MKKTGVRQMIFGILGSLACGVSVMGCYPLVPAYFTALYLEQVNGVVLLAFMYIGMTLFMPLTAAVKYGVTLIVMIGAVKLIEWANEGCPAFLAGVMAGLTTLILSFCGSLLEWKNQPDGAAVFLEAVFIFGAVILLNRGIHFLMEWTPVQRKTEELPERGNGERLKNYARVTHDAWRMRGDIREILAALESVGETKCICRNEYAVHEQVGAFTNQHLNGHAGLILNPRALDLRLFLNQWASVFHIKENTARGERQSIQFFDHQGDALLKVYATDNTDMAAWSELLARFITDENTPLELKAVDAPVVQTRADASVVEQEWRAMTDVHQFFTLLKRHNLTRQQAFNLVADDLACKVSNSALAQILESAQQDGNEIMVFVGNRGCVQIFTGVVEKVVPMKGWLNIFNPTFTLHLLEESIAEAWVTRKPTSDGHVTSLELFAHDGTQIAQLYGQRTEGEQEQAQWRKQIASLIPEGVTA